MKPIRVLFVCTGNICRSPMAEALFRAKAEAAGESDRWEVSSAGTWGVDGSPTFVHASDVMSRRDISMDGHIARTITGQMLRDSDVVIVMTRSHRDALVAEFPEARAKIRLMSQMNDMQYDVADPYGKPLAAYEECADTLEQLIARGYERTAQWARPDTASVKNV